MLLVKNHTSYCIRLVLRFKYTLSSPQIPSFNQSIVISTDQQGIICKMNSIYRRRMSFFYYVWNFSWSIYKCKSFVLATSGEYWIVKHFYSFQMDWIYNVYCSIYGHWLLWPKESHLLNYTLILIRMKYNKMLPFISGAASTSWVGWKWVVHIWRASGAK